MIMGRLKKKKKKRENLFKTDSPTKTLNYELKTKNFILTKQP